MPNILLGTPSQKMASKFRSMILESAERIAAGLEGNDPQEKVDVKVKPNERKRALVLPEERPSKCRKTRAGKKLQMALDDQKPPDLTVLSQCLQPVAPSKLNVQSKAGQDAKGNSNLARMQTGQSLDVLDENHKSDSILHIRPLVHLSATPKRRTDMQHTLTIPSDTGARSSPQVDPGAYIDDESDSLFDELTRKTPSAQVASPISRDKGREGAYLPVVTPIKINNDNPSVYTPTPPSLSSSQAPSPASTDCSTTSAISPIKPFLRQLPVSSMANSSIDIPWLQAKHRIWTCFRIAEVMRAQAQPVPLDRSESDVTRIELYARIKSVAQRGTQTMIQLADMFFPTRPPYLIGICNVDEVSAVAASLASAVSTPTFSTHSSQSSRNGSDYNLVRAILSARQGMSELEVHGIRETTWAEVELVRGVVEPQYQETRAEKPMREMDGPAAIMRR